MADNIAHKVYYVAEATRGTTPATPALTTIRHTSCNLALAKETFKSAEIDSTRNLIDFRHGNRQVGGDIGFELSVGSFDDFIQALMMGTWATNVLKVGTTRRSFSIVRNFTDQAAGVLPFHRFTGCEVNKMNLKLVAGKVVSGSFGFLGKNVAYEGTATTGATYPAITTSTVIDAFTGSLTVDGVANADITELTLNIENGLAPNYALFDDTSQLPSTDMCNVSGELGIYFRDNTFLQKFLAQTYTNLVFSMMDQANAKGYTIRIPKISLTGGQPDVSGGGPIQLKVPFQAVYDSTVATSLQITRIP